MKKLLALILALVMCFSLVACGGDKQEEEAAKPAESEAAKPAAPAASPTQSAIVEADKTVKYKDTVKISVASERQITGYYGSTNQAASYLGYITLQSLFNFDYTTNSVVPVLAKDAVDVNGDGKTWKVTLRDDVKFHDQGKDYADLKASDVKFTFDFIAPGGAGREAGAVTRTLSVSNYIDSIDVNGDYELTFHLNSALFDFPGWTVGVRIVSEKAVEEFGPADGQDVFTGPYYINKAESALGQQWVLTRYEDYYGGLDLYATKNIVLVVHTDVNTGAAALQAGEVDVLADCDATLALQFENNDAFTVHNNTGVTNWFVGYNSYDGTGFFDNEDSEEQIKLRRAICHGLDRDKIVSVMFAANPAAGTRVDNVFGPQTDGYVDQGKWEYDLEYARGLMAELGYNEDNRLNLILAHIPRSTTYAQVVQDQLKDIYIDCELRNLEGTQYGSFLRTGKDWDLFVNYYSTNAIMASTMTSHIHSTGSGSKTQGWNSAEADKRIDEVMAQTSKEAQLAAFAEFQEWVHDYHSRIPTHSANILFAAKAEVEGISISPDLAYQNYAAFRIPE